ncbi:MAG: hypothetical protein WCD49_04480 [Candidatus Acidiferrales bacterium]
MLLISDPQGLARSTSLSRTIFLLLNQIELVIAPASFANHFTVFDISSENWFRRSRPSFQVEIVAGAELYDLYVESGEKLSRDADFWAMVEAHEVG